jgi:hypothetical protein
MRLVTVQSTTHSEILTSRVDWQWQAADTAVGKARMGGDLVGRNPTDRGKKG